MLIRGRQGVLKECAEDRKSYNGAKKQSESIILDVSLYSSLSLAFFMESCNRSPVVQMVYLAYAPNKER